MIALIFDMDGVMIDSNPMHREAWAVFNRRFGLETTEAMHQSMYGKRNDQIVRDFFGDALTAGEVAARGARQGTTVSRDDCRPHRRVLGAGPERFSRAASRSAAWPWPATPNRKTWSSFWMAQACAGISGWWWTAIRCTTRNLIPKSTCGPAELLETEPANCIVFEDSYSGVASRPWRQGCGLLVCVPPMITCPELS